VTVHCINFSTYRDVTVGHNIIIHFLSLSVIRLRIQQLKPDPRVYPLEGLLILHSEHIPETGAVGHTLNCYQVLSTPKDLKGPLNASSTITYESRTD